MTNRATRAASARTTGRPRPRRVVRRSSPRKRFKTFLALTFLFCETIIALVAVTLLVIFWRFSTDLPSTAIIAEDVRSPVATTIWSQDGVLLGRLEVQNRQPILLDQVPKNVINATVAIEDHRFYEHPGIDVQGIARAAIANIRGSSLRQGASTLTQQLVRQPGFGAQFGLTTEKKFTRKVREALIALRVEQVYSKKEILQLYLNNVYYGAGAYGIQAASETYFGKSAYKLNLAEAALLAGLPQRPSSYTPFEHRQTALQRRDEVLDAMQHWGYITPEQCEQAKGEKLRLMPAPKHNNFDFKAPYFTTYVLRQLMRKYGSDYVYRGLRIDTTLNWKMQQMAEKALENGLEHASDKSANQGAIVSLDNQTGYIRALVGGRNFHADQYNAITQGRRQPGSTFKLFDYSTAIDTGDCTLDSTFPDEDFYYPGDPKHRKVSGDSGRLMDIRSAIKYSKNAVAIRVAQKVGIKTIIAYAHKMGITTYLTPLLPTALGGSAVRPLDLCSAYSVIATKGLQPVPMSIVRVIDADGNVVEEHTPEYKTDILKDSTIKSMDEAFEGVVTGGTGVAARGNEANGIVENARGKTGTTNDNRDVWFAGYTPELTTVVWAASVHRDRHGHKVYQEMSSNAYGGTVCAPIWHDFMILAVPEQRKFKLPQVAENSPPPPPPSDTDSDKSKPKVRHTKKTVLTASDKKDGFDQAPGVPDTAPDANNNPDNSNDSGDTGDTTDDSHAPQTAPPTTSPAPDVAPNRGNGLAEPPQNRATYTAPSPGSLRASAPSTAAPAAPSEPRMVTVEICVDSGGLATKWCSTVKSVRMTAAQAAKLHRCRIHHAPPGEQ